MAAVLTRAFSVVRWLVILEIGVWRSLFLLVMRRVPGQGPGVQAFAYAKEVAPIMAAFIFVSVLELVVVHLLLPWETVRLIADVLSIWGLVWMVGFLASMKVFPHLLDDVGLRIRYGTTADIAIPWEAVATVTSSRGSVPTRHNVQVERSDEGVVVDVAVLKQTRVDVVLSRPTTVKLPDGTEEITELRFYVDDPRALVARAREHLADRLAGQRLTNSPLLERDLPEREIEPLYGRTRAGTEGHKIPAGTGFIGPSTMAGMSVHERADVPVWYPATRAGAASDWTAEGAEGCYECGSGSQARSRTAIRSEGDLYVLAPLDPGRAVAVSRASR